MTLLAGCEVAYGEMLDKFRSHARVLARLRDLPTMIPLYDIFEENGTAYTVSEKVGGVTLAARLRQSGGRMSWDEARPLFMPLFAALVRRPFGGDLSSGDLPGEYPAGF